MLSFNRKLQYPLKPIFREYITKFMNQYTQPANEINPALLITNNPLKYTENTDDVNSLYPSIFWGGVIFFSVSTGIYLLISRKR